MTVIQHECDPVSIRGQQDKREREIWSAWREAPVALDRGSAFFRIGLLGPFILYSAALEKEKLEPECGSTFSDSETFPKIESWYN